MPALHKVIIKNDMDSFTELLTVKAEPLETPNHQGLTALQVAAREGRFEMAIILIEAGALVNPPISRLNYANINSFYFKEAKKSPLYLALERGHIKTAILLQFCDGFITSDKKPPEEMQKKLHELNAYYAIYLPSILINLVSNEQSHCVELFLSHILILPDDLIEILKKIARDLIPLAAKLNNEQLVNQLVKFGFITIYANVRNALYWAAYNRNDKIYNTLVSTYPDEIPALAQLQKDRHKKQSQYYARKLSQDDFNRLLKFKIKPLATPLTRFQEKIYRMASLGNSNSLNIVCEQEEKNIIEVLKYAYEANDFVAIQQILLLELDYKYLFNLSLNKKLLPLSALLLSWKISLTDAIKSVPPSLFNEFILNFAGTDGILQNIYSQQDLIAHYRVSKSLASEEKEACIERKLIKPLLLNIQDEVNQDLSELIYLSEQNQYHDFKNLLSQKILPINVPYLLSLYEFKNFKLHQNQSKPKAPQIIWKIISNDFLINDEKSLMRLSQTSKDLNSIISQFRTPNQRAIIKKNNQIEMIKECIGLIESEVKKITWWTTYGKVSTLLLLISVIMAASFGAKLNAVLNEIADIISNMPYESEMDLAILQEWDGDCSLMWHEENIQTCLDLKTPNSWAQGMTAGVVISAVVGFVTLIVLICTGCDSNKKNLENTSSFNPNKLLKNKLLEATRGYDFNFRLYKRNYDAIHELNGIIVIITNEIRDLNLTMPHYHSLFKKQNYNIEIKEDQIEKITDDETNKPNDENDQLNSSLLIKNNI